MLRTIICFTLIIPITVFADVSVDKTRAFAIINQRENMNQENRLSNENLYNEMNNVTQKVRYILSLSKTELPEHIDELADCLNAIQKLSLSMPENSTNKPADIYFVSNNLRDLTYGLVHYLADKNLVQYEYYATIIYANINLRFFNTNHALVGDGMIKSAKIYEKMNDTDMSKKIYSAILKDFPNVLTRLESIDEKVDENDEMLLALGSLETACEQLIAFNHLSGENANAIPILQRIKAWRTKQANL